MGDRKRRLGSREAFTVPRAGEGIKLTQSFEPLSINAIHKSPPRTQNLPYHGTGYITTPDKSGTVLSNDGLTKMYANCIQLATENVCFDSIIILYFDC
jgi:hypothetical protein